MSQVYQNAYLTLAIAVPPTEAHLGLFRRGAPSEPSSSRFFCPLKDGSSEEVLVMKGPQLETYGSSPLVSRAWCFQEREISQRVVHYTETQVLWECRTIRASEGLPNGVGTQSEWIVDQRLGAWPGRMLDSDFSDGDVNHAWHKAVEDYSARALTETTDKLPALAGLAAAVHDRYKPATCRYVAGLWQDDIRPSLAWWSRNESHTNKRYPTYVAPTWSWASIAGPVSYENLYLETSHCNRSGPRSDVDVGDGNNSEELTKYYAWCDSRSDDKYALQVLDVSVQTSTNDRFGAIRHTSAVLRCIAALIPTVLDCSFTSEREVSLAHSRAVDKEYIGTVRFDILLEKSAVKGMKDVVLIPLGVRGCCDPALVVVPTASQENEYMRVGLLPARISREYLTAAQIKEITII